MGVLWRLLAMWQLWRIRGKWAKWREERGLGEGDWRDDEAFCLRILGENPARLILLGERQTVALCVAALRMDPEIAGMVRPELRGSVALALMIGAVYGGVPETLLERIDWIKAVARRINEENRRNPPAPEPDDDPESDAFIRAHIDKVMAEARKEKAARGR